MSPVDTDMFVSVLPVDTAMLVSALPLSLPQLLPKIPTSDCVDIYSCRTWWDIVGPAVTALFASVFLDIHQNVPQPGLSLYRQIFNSGIIIVVTLLFPEWIFAWAMRTFYVALKKRDELEAARMAAKDRWGVDSFVGDLPLACESRNSTAQLIY